MGARFRGMVEKSSMNKGTNEPVPAWVPKCLECSPVGLAHKGGEATEQGGVSTGCAKIALFEDFGGGVSEAFRSPKSSKGAATGLSRAEGD